MTQKTESPATLFAIIVAAKRVGDRELERAMRRQLKERFRAKISFAREQKDLTEGGDDGP